MKSFLYSEGVWVRPVTEQFIHILWGLTIFFFAINIDPAIWPFPVGVMNRDLVLLCFWVNSQ